MRLIKFRGLTEAGMLVCGNLTVLSANHQNIKVGYYISNSAGLPFAYKIRPETVGQFTGLPDKQGKEIYEGDVVEVNEGGEISIHQVRWFGDYNYPAFDLDPDLDCECNGLQHIASGDDITMTVIGNIYNNPELLKEAK